MKNALADLFCWFASNQMKANPNKCHLIASWDNEININNKYEKLLVIKIAHRF